MSPSVAASRSASLIAGRLSRCLPAAGVGLKLETDARHIDADAADRLAALAGAMCPDFGRWRDGVDA